MNEGARIREATPADAASMVEVIEAAYRGDGGWTTESHLVAGARTSVADVEQYIADTEHVVLVAEAPASSDDHAAASAGTPARAARIIGCCYVRLPQGDDLAEFGLFAVDPRIQGGGIGSRLLEAAETRVRAAGAEQLMIQVLQTRPELRAWYERRRFVPTGTVLPFPGVGLRVEGLGMDELVKRLA
ncbi:GNAT family N-acetyltransferase [Brachybacterium huguangmaarense]|uniref:GNAT family N-acetyltransferase n=1 Tax=Brachybacterium huguangmaarense TaxID=1652028 RepID=A0ABY6G203_9MICO|nr:GNAT family N-acetyltransferase [Brachybacterium huguangmaarense]UYG17242.1 GNAT family N-acetyltransferase [Brachybacterium huguangmaarense]